MEKELSELLRQIELIRQRALDTHSAWHRAKVDAMNADGEYRKLAEESNAIERQVTGLRTAQNEIQRKMNARRKEIENTPEMQKFYVDYKEAEAVRVSMEQRLNQAFVDDYKKVSSD
jgi:chromosome segregation ATPase